MRNQKYGRPTDLGRGKGTFLIRRVKLIRALSASLRTQKQKDSGVKKQHRKKGLTAEVKQSARGALR